MTGGVDLVGAIGGAAAGFATAIGTGYLVSGSFRKRRLERKSVADERVAQEEEDKKWRVRVSQQLEGQPPSRFTAGFRGVVERVDNLEVETFGGTRAAIEPTGRAKA